MKMTRKEFIEALTKEAKGMPKEELLQLIKYYEEILDEQNIFENDFVSADYNPKKIINDFKLENNFKNFNENKKNGFKNSILLIVLSILSMPTLLILLLIAIPIIIALPIILIVLFSIFVAMFSLIFTFTGLPFLLFCLGGIFVIVALIILIIQSILHLFKYLAKKFSSIAMKNKKQKIRNEVDFNEKI